MEKRIRVKDLAPIASIETLSDECEGLLEGDKPKITAANTDEQTKMSVVGLISTNSITGTNGSSGVNTNLNTISNIPRIGLSRVRSSSYQEDSSAERELILGKAKDSKLTDVFGEELASELRSSTEEFLYHENEDAVKNRLKKSSTHNFSPTNKKQEGLRKNFECNDNLIFVPINGGTSQVSFTGSVEFDGSASFNNSTILHSSTKSCTSSTLKHPCGSSPPRNSVETSFCGQKPVYSGIDDKYIASVSKKTCLPRISTKTNCSNRTSDQQSPELIKPLKSQIIRKSLSMPPRKRPTIENPKTQKFVSLHSDEDDKSVATDNSNSNIKSESVAHCQSKPGTEKTLLGLNPRTQVYIPLRGDSIEEHISPTVISHKKEIDCKPNTFSFRRMKPFTNSILINFISKYDAFKESRTATSSPIPQQKMYEEFQRFISQLDDDDPRARDVSKSSPQSRVDRTATPTDVHRRRSLSDAATIKDKVQLSKSQTRMPTSTSPMQLVNQQQATLRLCDSLKGQHHCDSSETKVMNQCHSTVGTSSFLSSSSIPSYQSELHFQQLDRSRSAKSMAQLSCTSNSRSVIACSTNNNKAYDGTRRNEYLTRYRRSESAEEMRNTNKIKSHSRSGSFKSLLRTFFKRNTDLKTDKTNHTESAADIESKSPQIPLKTGTTVESIIIPLR